MTRDDVTRMAREAGMPSVEITSKQPVLYPAPDAIERFARLVAAEERERILAICTAKEAEFVAESDKRRGEEDSPFFFGKEIGAEELIDAIRARGEV